MKIVDYPNITTLVDTDLLLVQTSVDGAYKNILVSDLKKIFGSGSTTPSLSLIVTLTYSADGDTNGLCYWLGTSRKTTTFVNPAINGATTNTIVTPYASNYQGSDITNRLSTNQDATTNLIGSYYQVSLNAVSLIPSYYSIRARNYNSDLPANWIFQGSTDGTGWDTLDAVSNNPLTINQWCSRPVTSSKQYKSFRWTNTGASSSGTDYFCIGQVELYGKVYGSS